MSARTWVRPDGVRRLGSAEGRTDARVVPLGALDEMAAVVLGRRLARRPGTEGDAERAAGGVLGGVLEEVVYAVVAIVVAGVVAGQIAVRDLPPEGRLAEPVADVLGPRDGLGEVG